MLNEWDSASEPINYINLLSWTLEGLNILCLKYFRSLKQKQIITVCCVYSKDDTSLSINIIIYWLWSNSDGQKDMLRGNICHVLPKNDPTKCYVNCYAGCTVRKLCKGCK